jgi:hypothetical protein
MGKGSKPARMGKTLKRLQRPSLAGEFCPTVSVQLSAVSFQQKQKVR